MLQMSRWPELFALPYCTLQLNPRHPSTLSQLVALEARVSGSLASQQHALVRKDVIISERESRISTLESELDLTRKLHESAWNLVESPGRLAARLSEAHAREMADALQDAATSKSTALDAQEKHWEARVAAMEAAFSLQSGHLRQEIAGLEGENKRVISDAQMQLSAIRAQHAIELEGLVADHNERLEAALRDASASRLHETGALQRELLEIQSKFEALRDENDTIERRIRTELQVQHVQDIERLTASHLALSREAALAQDQSMSLLRNELIASREKLDQLDHLTQQQAAQIAASQRSFDDERESLNSRHAVELARLATEHRLELEALTHDAEASQLQALSIQLLQSLVPPSKQVEVSLKP